MSKLGDYEQYMLIDKHFSPNTVREYCRDIRRFQREAKCKLPKATEEQIQKWLNRLQTHGKNKPQSVARKIAALTSFAKWLKRHGFLKKSPLKHIEKPKAEKRLYKCLTLDEVQRILATHIERKDPAHEARDTAMLQLMYGSGLRRAEVCSVNVGHLEESGKLRVIGKGDKEREVYLTRAAIDAIRLYLAYRPDAKATEPLFLTSQNTRLSPRHLWVCFRQIVKAAGITKHCTPHTMRHAYATHLLENGADLITVQQLLGHSSVATTQTYVNISDQHRREQFEKAHPLGRAS